MEKNNSSNCVAPPKEAKASTTTVAVSGIFTPHNFANLRRVKMPDTATFVVLALASLGNTIVFVNSSPGETYLKIAFSKVTFTLT